MDKRLPIALVLSFLVLVGWGLISQHFWPAPPPNATPAVQEPAPPAPTGPAASNESTAATPQASASTPDISPRVEESTEKRLVLRVGKPGEVGSYLATFTNRGARLSELRIGNFYVDEKVKGDARQDSANWTTLLSDVQSSGTETASLGLRAAVAGAPFQREELDRALWTMRELDDHSGVEFELAPGLGLRFKKRVRFVPNSYRVTVELELQNDGFDGPKIATFRFTPAEVVPAESGDTFYAEPQAIAAGRAANSKPYDEPELKAAPRDPSGRTPGEGFAVPASPLVFAGVMNKYFAVLLRPSEPHAQASLTGAMWRGLRDDAFAAKDAKNAEAAWRFIATDVVLSLDVPEKGKSTSWGYELYAGPKDNAALAAVSADFEQIAKHDLSMYRIARVLVVVLKFFHSLTGNWGIAIILLTFSVRLMLFPINRRSQTAMARYQKKMKRVQPEIDALKKRYANDATKLRQEQAALMQREGLMPPLGGCLPMFVQIPVFFGLFSALRTCFDLRQAPFALWITDLAKPDRLMPLHWTVPFLGKEIEYLNVLPPLMVVLWVTQQMLMPKPADEQQARVQKMMMFMPVMMGFFLYNYAAGLSLYMITQSTLGIIETSVIKKYWPIDDKEVAPTKTGFLARLARMQEEQQRKLKGQSGDPRRDSERGKGGKGPKKK